MVAAGTGGAVPRKGDVAVLSDLAAIGCQLPQKRVRHLQVRLNAVRHIGIAGRGPGSGGGTGGRAGVQGDRNGGGGSGGGRGDSSSGGIAGSDGGGGAGGGSGGGGVGGTRGRGGEVHSEVHSDVRLALVDGGGGGYARGGFIEGSHGGGPCGGWVTGRHKVVHVYAIGVTTAEWLPDVHAVAIPDPPPQLRQYAAGSVAKHHALALLISEDVLARLIVVANSAPGSSASF
mmetsp:Transcript_90750/g.211136  ORF Transcript_90750/g.211136 Transcript_90750/m.211136 type:complete len:231 (-) Transcript_90750:853-1545(-)